MTEQHNCSNCRYSVQYYKRMLCANVESSRNVIKENEWCSKWEAETNARKESI